MILNKPHVASIQDYRYIWTGADKVYYSAVP